MAGYQPIIHRLKKAKWHLQALRSAYWLEGAFRSHPDLTIITVKTYRQKSFLEASLEYLGVSPPVVLNEPFEGRWRSTLKVQFILNYLHSGQCKTKYLLYCDATDTIIRDDPHKILELFKEEKVDLLFCSTMSPLGYVCMPDRYEWTKVVAPKSSRYLNAGGFIGRSTFIEQVLLEANKYIDPKQYRIAARIKRIEDCQKVPDFPLGTSDQIILRYVFPEFYPSMDLDYINRIFYRN